MRESWEDVARRRMRRRLVFVMPLSAALCFGTIAIVEVADDEPTEPAALALVIGVVVLAFGLAWLRIVRGLRSETGVFAPSQLLVMDRRDRRPFIRRLRRGEPAPDLDAAQIQDAAARTVVDYFRGRLVWLLPLMGILLIPDAITGDGPGGRWAAIGMLVLLMGAWGLGWWYRRQAQRALEANRRQWGDPRPSKESG